MVALIISLIILIIPAWVFFKPVYKPKPAKISKLISLTIESVTNRDLIKFAIHLSIE